MVLNMLRLKLGDVHFFQGLKNYLSDSNLAYGYALTTDFKSHMEAVYGSSLTEFFNDWIYKQGYPTYTITAQNWSAGQAKVTVSQTQSNASVSFFEMPLPIRFTGVDGQTFDTIIDNTFNNQEFIVSVPFSITDVQFDPKKDIISNNNLVTLSNNTFELDQIIEVYPNPVLDQLHIQIPSNFIVEKISIFNNIGQLVQESAIPDFSIATLSAGILYARIQTSQGTYHKKIIKK
jgi:hypothetical protein